MTRSGEFLFFVAASANVLPYSQEKKNICQKIEKVIVFLFFLHLNFRKADLDWRLATILDSMSGYSEDHLREKLIKVFPHFFQSCRYGTLYLEKRSKLYLHQVAGFKHK
jgi:hypothetical protein